MVLIVSINHAEQRHTTNHTALIKFCLQLTIRSLKKSIFLCPMKQIIRRLIFQLGIYLIMVSLCREALELQ
nr:MAG TPA: hypothetical protein [Caudoviricetes sp.]